MAEVEVVAEQEDMSDDAEGLRDRACDCECEPGCECDSEALAEEEDAEKAGEGEWGGMEDGNMGFANVMSRLNSISVADGVATVPVSDCVRADAEAAPVAHASVSIFTMADNLTS